MQVICVTTSETIGVIYFSNEEYVVRFYGIKATMCAGDVLAVFDAMESCTTEINHGLEFEEIELNEITYPIEIDRIES